MLKQGRHLHLFALLLSACLLAAPALAQDSEGMLTGAIELDPVEPWVSDIDLRDLPEPPEWRPGDPIKVIPRRLHPKPPEAGLTQPTQPELAEDPLAVPQPEADLLDRAFTTPLLNFDGQGFSGVYPADPVGEAGPGYYVQMINGSTGTRTTFYDKTTGTSIASFLLQDLAPSGSACRNGLGDPIPLYDHLAGRWFLSEFADNPPNALCLYISKTGDPISGGWFHYQINTQTFPDYPKYAVWPDAYYVNTNENSLSVYALDRERMLQGLPLRPTQKFVAPDLLFWFFQSLPPIDLDGPPPPAGTPAYFIRQRDTELHNPTQPSPLQDFIELWPFRVNWNNPAASTFGPITNISIADFSSLLCDPINFQCIPQPGGQPLDPLREPTMWKPQYRNFGTHESIVGNFSVRLDSPNHAGVRWFELRRTPPNPTGPWTLFQQGTWAGTLGQVDPTSRWMAGSGMDKAGNIAIGYDVSSAVTFPGVRYTGRLATDPLGTMSQGDITIVEGTGPALPFERWGDYNSLNVDTVDDCTFWFTSMYGRKDSPTHNPLGNWFTRIGSFKFDNCAPVTGNRPPVARADLVTTEPNTPVTIDVLADNGNGEDFDPDEGDTLTVTSVSDPPNGTATHLGGGLVDYEPDTNFIGDDSFTYELCDDGDPMLCATGTVEVTVACPETTTEIFTDDFEPLPEAGWVVDTPINNIPASVTWTAGPDPFAQSPVSSFFTDATTLDLKDDRLIAPPVDLTADSRLTFWHRFETESGFDGGVLEVSTDGGANWTDLGDQIVTGGYNGSISTEYGNPILGRLAWTGSSGDPDVMVRVEVELGAFAGSSVLVRWRFGADQLVVGSLPGVGWWVDDVAFFDLSVECELPPNAVDDQAETTVDTAVVIDVLANDSDPDGDPLTVGPGTQTTSVNGGSITNNGSDVTYDPPGGFTGTDSFTYEACDPGDLCDTATVTVEVIDDVNRAPVADDQAVSTPEDTAVRITLTGSDPDGDALVFTIVSGPSNGALTGAPPDVTYTPDPNYNGPDSFVFEVCDRAEESDPDRLCDTATVTITVEPVNDPPVAADDAYSTDEDTELTVAAPGVLGNDSDVDDDPLSAVGPISPPSNGTLFFAEDGSFSYMPNANYNGADSFTYEACDRPLRHPDRLCDEAQVTITVNPVNDAPTAGDDAYETNEDTPLTVPAPGVLANDGDVDGDPLTASGPTSSPMNGNVVLNADGSFTYTPSPDFFGTDSFTYDACDNGDPQLCDGATVTITVHEVPELGVGDKVTGGGWLLSDEGAKINFGFNAKQKAQGPQGNLQLNDKTGGVKIHLSVVNSISNVTGSCGSVGSGPNSIQFSGMGTFNNLPAEFRVCIEDNGEPGNEGPSANPDRFYLECTSGCTYSTGARTPDDLIDGGNIQLHRTSGSSSQAAAGGSNSFAESRSSSEGGSFAQGGSPGKSQSLSGGEALSAGESGSARVLVLQPLLEDTAVLGSPLVLTAIAYDATGELAADAALTIRWAGAAGTGELPVTTGLDGSAAVVVPLAAGDTEYLAVSGAALTSNAVEIRGE